AHATAPRFAIVWCGVWVAAAVLDAWNGPTPAPCSAGSFGAWEAEVFAILAAPCLVAAFLGHRVLSLRGERTWRRVVAGILITAVPPFLLLSFLPIGCI